MAGSVEISDGGQLPSQGGRSLACASSVEKHRYLGLPVLPPIRPIRDLEDKGAGGGPL